MVSDAFIERTARRSWTATEITVLDAVKACCERWGIDKTTIDDIAKQSGISRATLYRLFPGGRDVIFEAHRVHELDEFFSTLLAEVVDYRASTEPTLHGLLARTVAVAMRELADDQHLAAMLASEPGHVINELTVDGMPRIIRVATAYMTPLVDEYLPPAEARALIELTVRLVISYFLAPSELLDLRDEGQAYRFIAPFIPDPSTPQEPETP